MNFVRNEENSWNIIQNLGWYGAVAVIFKILKL